MKKTAIRWHVLGWLLYLAYQYVGNWLQNPPALLVKNSWLLLSINLVRLVEFYLCYLVVYPRWLRAGRGAELAAGLSGVVAVFIALRYGLEEVLYPALLGFHNYNFTASAAYNLGFYIGDNLYFAAPMLVLSAALWTAQAALRRERENRQLREEKRSAELAFLKTQINPHFLYNTLNMLFSLARPVAPAVAEAILKLSELMRYLLHDTPDGQVELRQEIEYLHHFLALYRLRFPEAFHVEFEVSGEPAGRRVAPLLLIPLVENAIKHGVLDDAATPVRIRLELAGATLRFAVDNQCSDYHRDASTGVGLPNLRRRLALLYPGRHRLQAAPADGQFRAELRLLA